MEKVTHDAVNRLIVVTDPPVGGAITLNVLSELYSASKREWMTNPDLNKLKFPWLAEGGRILPGGAQTPRSFVLLDPWKIRPYEDSHSLILTGNIFAESGGLTIPTIGTHTISIQSVFDVGLPDSRIETAVNILQADEHYHDDFVTKRHKDTKNILVRKTRSGGLPPVPDIDLTEPV